MKITAIKQQITSKDRYSVFIEGKYTFSLSATALLDSEIATGQELSEKQVSELKQTSADDKLYGSTLRYAATRTRSRWEVEQYLKRKKASPALTSTILNKLSNIGLINDEKFAEVLVNDRKLLRPTSRRKMVLELRQKHVGDEAIHNVMAEIEPQDEQTALQAVVAKKRRIARYQDDTKLMQYLARQGFNYDDIKVALKGE